MFSSQFNIPKQHYRVDAYPTVDELNGYIEKASSMVGIKHCFEWAVPDSSEMFTLSIHFNPKGGAPEWWMHETTELGQRMIWFYRTEDLAIIYRQILDAVGAPNPFEDEENDENRERDGTLTSQLKAEASGYATPGSIQKQQQEKLDEQQKVPLGTLLSGDLAVLSIASILQTANKESATGRIMIEGDSGASMVQLVNGQAVHAYTPVQEGLEALLELFTWRKGTVKYISGTKPDKKTIQHPIEQVLYKGAELVEDISFLQEHHINERAVIKRADMKVSEKQFEKTILQGPPLGLELQKNFYKNVDSSRSLKDIATFLSLAPSQWVAITANLLRLELVLSPRGTTGVIKKEQPAQNPQLVPPAQNNQGGSPGQMNTNVPPLPGINPDNPNQPNQGSQNLRETGQFRQQATSSDNMRSSPQMQSQRTTVDKNPENSVRNSPQFQSQGKTLDKQYANPSSHQQSQDSKPPGGIKQDDTLDKHFANPNQNQGPKKAMIAPQGAFKVGGQGSQDPGSDTSPAVAAFMTSSTTMEIQTSIKLGVQEEEVKFDPGQAQAVRAAITNGETGILTFEGMQFLLEREYDRAFLTSGSLAFIVFSMKIPSSHDTRRSGVEAVRQSINAIKKIKSKLELFGHFGERGYALIMPDSNSNQAVQLVDKITTNITKFAPDLKQIRPVFFFGIASVPNDAQNVSSLMNSAQVAMLEASKRGVTRIQFSELR